MALRALTLVELVREEPVLMVDAVAVLASNPGQVAGSVVVEQPDTTAETVPVLPPMRTGLAAAVEVSEGQEPMQPLVTAATEA